MKIAIIGAGIAGLAAAYDLAGAGHEVTLFEAAARPGGLAAGFKPERWDWSLEHYYHHWFTGDLEILNLIDELGQTDKVIFRQPITSLWHKGRAYPFDNYVRMAIFPHLSLFDKLRAAPAALYLRFTRSWRSLEQYTAHEWCIRWLGQRNYEVLMKPLLVGKFGRYYKEVNMAWLWARVYKRSARLGYFVGGFQAFVDALTDQVRQRGAELRLNAPIGAVSRTEAGFQVQVEGENASQPGQLFDRVLATVSPQLLGRMVPILPEDYLASLKRLKSLGAVVMVLALKHSLSGKHYWINLPKEEGFPFLALVEHTNYMDREHYNNEHLIYCGDYLPPDHEYFSLSQEELLERFLPTLKRFNPDFSREWLIESWLFRTRYAQPIPPVNHSANIPPLETPLPGLYWASMSQVYPWDRGTNYAVQIGRRAARLLMKPG